MFDIAEVDEIILQNVAIEIVYLYFFINDVTRNYEYSILSISLVMQDCYKRQMFHTCTVSMATHCYYTASLAVI